MKEFQWLFISLHYVVVDGFYFSVLKQTLFIGCVDLPFRCKIVRNLVDFVAGVGFVLGSGM